MRTIIGDLLRETQFVLKEIKMSNEAKWKVIVTLGYLNYI